MKIAIHQRAEELLRKGAKPWRVAPSGRYPGYKGPSLTGRSYALAMFGIIVALVAPLLTLYQAGFRIVVAEQVAVAARPHKLGKEAHVDADQTQSSAALPAEAVAAVAQIVRAPSSSAPLTWLTSGAGESSSEPAPDRVRALTQLTGWLASQEPGAAASALDRLTALAQAMDKPELLAAMQQVVELSPDTRRALFENKGQRPSELISIVHALVAQSGSVQNLFEAVRNETHHLQTAQHEYKQQHESIYLQIRALEEARTNIYADLRSRRIEWLRLNLCYHQLVRQNRAR